MKRRLGIHEKVPANKTTQFEKFLFRPFPLFSSNDRRALFDGMKKEEGADDYEYRIAVQLTINEDPALTDITNLKSQPPKHIDGNSFNHDDLRWQLDASKQGSGMLTADQTITESDSTQRTGLHNLVSNPMRGRNNGTYFSIQGIEGDLMNFILRMLYISLTFAILSFLCCAHYKELGNKYKLPKNSINI
ncbi:uncharacterized protein LOC118192176 isoform X2 [Stegodyphus dumicola]|uniref:uncharacterized protein LOC118192176 isoform X2 n=1 Tax=Stegodyphus dumicola TaxID=202533 RepID=UPI0015AE383E|nr:uncharacterized protein LOC118192176 isoform X2 [Stegodyphus dumicola]